jgi:hypothetical protein
VGTAGELVPHPISFFRDLLKRVKELVSREPPQGVSYAEKWDGNERHFLYLHSFEYLISLSSSAVFLLLLFVSFSFDAGEAAYNVIRR